MPVLKNINTSGICLVTLSRPDALNALNDSTVDQLCEVMEEIVQNHEIKGVIITGDGDKAFVAGADIKELAAVNEREALMLSRKGQELFKKIENCPKPVIAAVNGFALGGGCELAMACHLRIATSNATFGQPEINLGIIPGYGGTQRLTQLLGRGKSLELLLTGNFISAEEAKTLGLVNHVVNTKEELMTLASDILNRIITKSPLAISKIIKSVNAGFGYEEKGYETEADCFAASVTTEDFKEGTSAFLQKRKPTFHGK